MDAVPRTATDLEPDGCDIIAEVACWRIFPRWLLAALGAAACGSGPVSPASPQVPAAPTIANIELAPATVHARENASATVILSAPADTGIVVNLSSSHSAATVPASVSIAAGDVRGSAVVTTQATPVAVDAVIRGTIGRDAREAILRILPGTSARLAAIDIALQAIAGGDTAVGTVSLGAPAPVDVDVTISSSHAAAVVPRTVQIPSGATTATFVLSTLVVPAATDIVIEATLGADTASTTIRILPPPLETFFAYISESGDYIGLGGSGRLAPPAHELRADALCGGNWVYIRVGTWSIEFSAPVGQPLRPGSYGGIGDIRDRLRPGLRVSGNAHACQRVTGHFTVTDALFGESGDVERFRVIFEQRCDGAAPALLGEVSLSSVPRANRQTLCFE